MHEICLHPQFEEYPEFKAEPYRLTVTIKPDDGHNTKLFWNTDLETLGSEITLQLDEAISLNYTAIDLDPEDTIRSKISDIGDSSAFLAIVEQSGGIHDPQ